MNLNKFISTTLVATAVFAAASAQAEVLLHDDFESYATTAEMEAVWTASAAGGIPLVVEAGQGALGSDKFLRQNSTAALTRTFAAAAWDSIDQVNLQYYARAADWSGTRAGVSIRSVDMSATYLHIGTYNSWTDNKWAVRLLGVPGIAGNYYLLANGPTRTNNVWTKLELQLTENQLAYEFDDVSYPDANVATTGFPTAPIAAVRVSYGVPSNKAVDYDNITAWTGIDSSVPDWDLY